MTHRYTNAEGRKLLAKASKRKWSAAVPTEVDGIRFASKMEARVYGRLKMQLQPGERLYCQVRFPLLALPPDERGRPLYFTPDFVVMFEGDEVYQGDMHVIEAKGSRRSRDWERGKRAFEATYGVKVEEVSE